MPLYEHVFLTRQDASPQQVETLTSNFQKIIEEHGGRIAKTEQWGMKSLAYKIKKNRKAHFTLMNIDAPHEAVAEMERQMRLTSDVLRFLTLRVEAHEEGPSVMMRKSERDERRGGRRFSAGGRRDERPPRGDGRRHGGRGDGAPGGSAHAESTHGGGAERAENVPAEKTNEESAMADGGPSATSDGARTATED